MYLEHFGLQRLPFQITPDVSFYFDSRAHSRALATIVYGLSKNEGFVVVTGEIGAGKTTLIEYLLVTGRLSDLTTAKVNTTQLEPGNLLAYIEYAFGFNEASATKAKALKTLGEFFARATRNGQRLLLIVDEVQNLTDAALEELRMLSNFQAEANGAFQMLLVGQPEFRERLRSPGCEQIRQRVVASYHLAPLARHDMRRYVEHRLNSAGWAGQEIFTPDALNRIHDVTEGLPRKINRLCDRLLLYAYFEDRQRVTADMVKAVEAELVEENLGGEGPSRGAAETEAAGNGPAGNGAAANVNGAANGHDGAPDAAPDAVVLDRDRFAELVQTIQALRDELTAHRQKLSRIADLVDRQHG
jgi:putative secretion ATPase (PEP-CTERM system associated)